MRAHVDVALGEGGEGHAGRIGKDGLGRSPADRRGQPCRSVPRGRASRSPGRGTWPPSRGRRCPRRTPPRGFVVRSADEAGEAGLRRENAWMGGRRSRTVGQTGTAAMLATAGGPGARHRALARLRLEVVAEHLSSLRAAAPWACRRQQAPVDRAGDEPREPPRLAPPAIGGEAVLAEPAPEHGTSGPADPASGEAGPDQGLVAGERAPQSLKLVSSESRRFRHRTERRGPAPERDHVSGLADPERADAEGVGEIAQGRLQPGGVGQEPAVEGLAGDRRELDRYPPHVDQAAPTRAWRLLSSPCSSAACSSRRASSAASSFFTLSRRSLVSRSSPLRIARRHPRATSVMSDAK